ncbi:MAG TPA: shikimate kinase [Balneolaceae bacterium]|nr:shikimate kinase [Balneolaceae bacterium]
MKQKTSKPIFLTGFMGAGKTAIGRALSDILHWRFVDLDEYIEQRQGQTITRIFEKKGEGYFRQVEREAVKRHLAMNESVIAAGGGALQNQQLTDKIKNKSLLIFIDCPVAEILKRLKDDKTRPLLLNPDSSEKKAAQLEKDLTQLYKKRLPLYNQAAFRVDSSKFSSPRNAALYLSQKINAHEY